MPADYSLNTSVLEKAIQTHALRSQPDLKNRVSDRTVPLEFLVKRKLTFYS